MPVFAFKNQYGIVLLSRVNMTTNVNKNMRQFGVAHEI